MIDPPSPAERQPHTFNYEIEKLECNKKVVLLEDKTRLKLLISNLLIEVIDKIISSESNAVDVA